MTSSPVPETTIRPGGNRRSSLPAAAEPSGQPIVAIATAYPDTTGS